MQKVSLAMQYQIMMKALRIVEINKNFKLKKSIFPVLHLIPHLMVLSLGKKIKSPSTVLASKPWGHPLLPPSPPAFNLSQHQGLFQ